MATKTRPKKLTFVAPDGGTHVFLMKGRDDLSLDARLLQMLRVANAFIGTRHLRTYDVIPFGPPAS